MLNHTETYRWGTAWRIVDHNTYMNACVVLKKRTIPDENLIDGISENSCNKKKKKTG